MYKCFFKSLFDIIGSLLLLPFVILAIIILSPIIYFTDKGPVFYNAKRTGFHCTQFKMFKFRSMYVNSPDIRNADGSTFNSDNDLRVTKVGKIMRKMSLDEIPQILNVLLGNMSFIGPRPTIGNDSIKYETLAENYKLRFSVKPGITGYAQAYFRNSINEEEKFYWDAYYVKHLSLWLDIKIFFKTIISVLRRNNINANLKNG